MKGIVEAEADKYIFHIEVDKKLIIPRLVVVRLLINRQVIQRRNMSRIYVYDFNWDDATLENLKGETYFFCRDCKISCVNGLWW